MTETKRIGGLWEHLLSWNDNGNAGAKTAKSTSAIQCRLDVMMLAVSTFDFIIIFIHSSL